MFFAVAAWGIADAILNFKPEVPAPSEFRLSAPAPVTKVSLAPVLDSKTLGARSRPSASDQNRGD
jgi:hypothetical protein